jgi:hypothetical protein
MAVHHIDVQNVGSAAFDCANFIAQTREVGGQDRGGDFDVHWFGTLGVGRGAAGRRLSLLLVREFVLPFTLDRGVTFAFPAFVFGLLAFAFAGRFAFPFALGDRLAFAFAFVFPFAFSFLFFGFLGLSSFAFDDEFVLRFSFDSSGATASGDSPALAGRLTSIATVCPAFTTSPARGN